MDATERRRKLNAIEKRVSGGLPLPVACAAEGASVAWWGRWHGRLAEGGLDGLADRPRAGRPAGVEPTEADVAALRSAYLRTNRMRGRGSMTMAARIAAQEGALSPAVAESILRPRASKHTLPARVMRACRASEAEVMRYRDPKSGLNDGIYIPGWLRMLEDGSRRLRPGEREVWDDLSVNVGVCVPWTRGGDKCADRYGVRVARYQLLGCLDCATDLLKGYAFVVRGNDAYSAADVVRAMHGVWQGQGRAPKAAVMEGASWQAHRTLRFLEAAGVQMVSAKGRPNQKLIEAYFNRFHSALGYYLPAGQVGRFRGEMKDETADWIACREGRRDPRKLFPDLAEFLAAADKAVAYLNRERVESATYGAWVPAEAYAARSAEDSLPIVDGLWRMALPVEAVVKVRRQGMVAHRCLSPFGMEHTYHFAWEGGYSYEGAEVVLGFDPYNVKAGACVSLAADWRGEKRGARLADGALCVGPAPDWMEAYGCTDPRAEAKRLKSASRALVAESIAAFDERGRRAAATLARGTSPRLAVADYAAGKAAHLEEDADPLEAIRRSRRQAALATDWTAAEKAAGIIA